MEMVIVSPMFYFFQININRPIGRSIPSVYLCLGTLKKLISSLTGAPFVKQDCVRDLGARQLP